MTSDNVKTPFPYREKAVIQTGHRGNIFNAHLLPSSSRMYVRGWMGCYDDNLTLANIELLSLVMGKSVCSMQSMLCNRGGT